MIELPERALSVKQPYAWAIAAGLKPIENRMWAPPDHSRGRLIAIHASSTVPKPADYDDVRDRMRDAGRLDEPPGMVERYARGAIIAVVVVKAFFNAAGARTLPRVQFAWVERKAKYCWLLAQVHQLGEPIPCTGALGLWKLKPTTRAALKAQLEIDARRAFHARPFDGGR